MARYALCMRAQPAGGCEHLRPELLASHRVDGRETAAAAARDGGRDGVHDGVLVSRPRVHARGKPSTLFGDPNVGVVDDCCLRRVPG